MWYDNLFIELEKLEDINQAVKMSNYMQNRFRFLGIPKVPLNKFIKPYLKESKKFDFDYNFILKCYSMDYREAQYIALMYLSINRKNIDIDQLKYLIITKSWWDTIDTLDSIVGDYVINNDMWDLMLEWSKSDNLWLRRVSIDFQLGFKEKTNTTILQEIINNNFYSKDLFINKSIGWSLREYSKTNPNWVVDFISNNKDKMSKLSIKEASKYLK